MLGSLSWILIIVWQLGKTSNIGQSKVLQLEVPRLKRVGFEYPLPFKQSGGEMVNAN